MTFDEIENRLEKVLPLKRMKHCRGVSEQAAKLARRYGVDEEKARLAGILHDCAKGFSTDEQKRMCEENSIALDYDDMICLPVIHAPLGAYLAKTVYGVEDEDILNAITYHTVGRANMSDLEKIIYISDMIEPNRSFDGVEKLRKAAEKGLDYAMKEILAYSIKYHVKKKTVIHCGTIHAWNEYMK